ncbi:hypothetical protein DFP72DRAFT_976568 [Ephemerocybe angulata]|uniref:DUF6697 domain-containing protein n=1 Tax=Ephemerocybe angulata TaxID=980116 RepID=A0A8H6LWS2_9AGAR|nr:hypothetical protein DFP72DRAFT_976568 [Tulosesus angulatus]
MALLTRSQVKQEPVETDLMGNKTARPAPPCRSQLNKGKGPRHIKKEHHSVKQELVKIRPRGRMVFDGVYVPTLQAARSTRLRVQKKAESPSEVKPIHQIRHPQEAAVKLENSIDDQTHFHPPSAIAGTTKVKSIKSKGSKLKGKKQAPNFDEMFFEQRYNAAGIPSQLYPIGLDQGAASFEFPRVFFAKIYGGSPRLARPPISPEKFAEHGLDDFLYCNLSYQPESPQVPGARGLRFGVIGTHAPPWTDGIMRVITRTQTTPQALWQYQGQYELVPSRSITVEEWARQKVVVRNNWISKLHIRKWGSWFRARIYARKTLGRDGTEQEVKAIQEGEGKRATLDPDKVTQDDVRDALTSGKDVLTVYTMRCVGYDVAFQRNLIKEFSTWVPKPSRSKNTSAVSKKKRPAGHDSDISGGDSDLDDLSDLTDLSDDDWE